MSRISKHAASKLISYIKKLDVKARFWDADALSAFEFYRQMDSPKLKKLNPQYKCNFEMLKEDSKSDAILEAEFTDGTKWVTPTKDFNCSDLRYELYLRAEEVADTVEFQDADDNDDDDGAGKKGAKTAPSKGKTTAPPSKGGKK